MDYQSSIRNGFLNNIDNKNRLLVQYTDNGFVTPPLARPVLGGINSGFHYQPAQNDQILILQEWPNRIVGTTTALDAGNATQVGTLQPGESAVYSNNDGHAAIYVDKSGNVSLLTSSYKTLSLSATVNGKVAITGTTVVTGDVTVNGHVYHDSAVGSASFARNTTNCGSSASTGFDQHGWINVTTAITFTNSLYQLGTLTFGSPFSVGTPVVVVSLDSWTPLSVVTLFTKNCSPSSFELWVAVPASTTLIASTSITVQYIVAA